MKAVVIIPACNEEKTIGKVIKEIPRNLCDEIKVIVIDDGSNDDTAKRAKSAGADIVYVFKRNKGLAQAFRKGLDLAIENKADIIVNIDADGQYDPKEIPVLIKPIVDNKADLVLGSRFKGYIEYMSRRKRFGNLIATKITNFSSNLHISDAQTGFRALSKEAALRLNIISDYTYTQEMIIQVAYKGLKIVEVPCTFKKRMGGESRLVSSIFSYAKNAGLTILRTYRDYKPLRTFSLIGGIFLLLGLLIGLRVLIHFFVTGAVTPYFPSVILTAILLIVGFQIIVLGLIADMIKSNRGLMDEVLYKLKKKETQE